MSLLTELTTQDKFWCYKYGAPNGAQEVNRSSRHTQAHHPLAEPLRATADD